MRRKLGRALIDIGSRGYVLSVILTSLVVGLKTCKGEAACVFEEGCGGGGGEDPGVTCGFDVCAEVLAGSCAETFECDENDQCRGATEIPGRDDGNLCTRDVCDGGAWKHVPLTAEELDDGNPCTIDECDPTAGPIHTNKC